jgi:hypothetical protein
MREYIKFVVSAGVLQGIKKEVLEERLWKYCMLLKEVGEKPV